MCTQLCAYDEQFFLTCERLSLFLCVFLCFLTWSQFVCHSVSYYVFLCIMWFLFGQYQRNQLPEKTRPWNDQLCNKVHAWDVKLYSLTHSACGISHCANTYQSLKRFTTSKAKYLSHSNMHQLIIYNQNITNTTDSEWHVHQRLEGQRSFHGRVPGCQSAAPQTSMRPQWTTGPNVWASHWVVLHQQVTDLAASTPRTGQLHTHTHTHSRQLNTVHQRTGLLTCITVEHVSQDQQLGLHYSWPLSIIQCHWKPVT